MSWCDFMAGCIGGCAGIVVGHPLDTLKVIQQAGGRVNLVTAAVNTAREEGARGFFKGMLYPLLSSGAINSIFFGVYGHTLSFFKSENESSGIRKYTEIFIAGCAGGGVQLAIACPVELIKVKLQTQTVGHHPYRGPWDCTMKTLKMQGVSGLYRGLVPHAWRDGPGFGAYMVLYEGGLAILGGRENSGKLQQFVAGGFAGVFCWLSVLPFDVVKSRMQADDPLKPKYRNMMDCARKSYAEGGVALFSRGWLAMSVRAFPVNAVTFLVYEWLLQHCNYANMDNSASNTS